MIKVLESSGLKGTYFKIIKTMYDNPKANIRLYGETLEAVSLKSGRKVCCTLFSLLFNIVFKVCAGTIRQKKEIKNTNGERGSQIIPVAI